MPTDDHQLHFEQPRSVFGTWLGIVLLFAIFALFVWVVMGVMPRGDSYEAKRGQARLEKLKTANEEAQKATAGYGWIDKEKGIARLPMQRAMELSVADLAQKKPVAANPIAPETAPGLQVTAPVGPAGAPTAPPQAVPDSSPKATTVVGPGSEINSQPAAAANPPNAAPGTQPGPMATPAASPPAGASQPQPGTMTEPTPVQQPPGTPLPVRGKQP